MAGPRACQNVHRVNGQFKQVWHVTMCRRVSGNGIRINERRRTIHLPSYTIAIKDGGICTEGLAPMGKALKFSDNAIETTTVLAEIQCHDTRSRSRLSNYDVLGWYWNQSEETRKCLSNALDVLATIDPFSEQIFRGRDLYASFRVISNERTGTLWYKLHDSQHGYGISLCQYICHHYVLCEPRSQRNHVSGIGVPIAQVISLIDVTKIGAQLGGPKWSIVFWWPHL
jgi:hypothetical protein